MTLDLLSWTPQSTEKHTALRGGSSVSEPDSSTGTFTAQFPPRTPPKCGVRSAGENLGGRSGTPQCRETSLEARGTAGATAASGFGEENGEVPPPADCGIGPKLRPYQLSAIQGVRGRVAAGDPRTLGLLPAGTRQNGVFAAL